jgi:hypothetical protein
MPIPSTKDLKAQSLSIILVNAVPTFLISYVKTILMNTFSLSRMLALFAPHLDMSLKHLPAAGIALM